MEVLRKQIEEYIPFNEQEEKDKQIMLDFIDKEDNLLTRENEVAHFTSSAWVVNKRKNKVLMAYHNIYDSWAWLGGHADGDNNLLRVALKEANEESGIKRAKPVSDKIFSLEIINVNGHEKHGKYVASHLHLNVAYLIEADEESELLKIKDDENKAVKWIPFEMINKEVKEEWVKQRIYAKLIQKLEN